MHLSGLSYLLLAAGTAAATSTDERSVHEDISSEELKKLLTDNRAVLASCGFLLPQLSMFGGNFSADDVPPAI